ncbi:hypothetical protein Hte_012411 [Hypoxylon texense]
MGSPNPPQFGSKEWADRVMGPLLGPDVRAFVDDHGIQRPSNWSTPRVTPRVSVDGDDNAWLRRNHRDRHHSSSRNHPSHHNSSSDRPRSSSHNYYHHYHHHHHHHHYHPSTSKDNSNGTKKVSFDKEQGKRSHRDGSYSDGDYSDGEHKGKHRHHSSKHHYGDKRHGGGRHGDKGPPYGPIRPSSCETLPSYERRQAPPPNYSTHSFARPEQRDKRY